MESDLLNEREAAQLLSISPATMNRWRCERVGPDFLRVSRRAIRYRRCDLERWLESRRVFTSDSRRLAAASGTDPREDLEAPR